jgi:hypothetical protein
MTKILYIGSLWKKQKGAWAIWQDKENIQFYEAFGAHHHPLPFDLPVRKQFLVILLTQEP